MPSDGVIDRLQQCSIDETVIAIIQDGSRFEGQVSGVDHTDQSDDERETFSVSVAVTDGTIERHRLVRDIVELRAERQADDTWGDIELVAWEPSVERTDAGVDVNGGRGQRLGIVDQLLRI